MKNIISILTTLYRFEAREDGAWWGIGSLMWGDTVTVKPFNGDLFEVTVHHWSYDQYGDCEVDTTTITVTHEAQVWGYIPPIALKGGRR